MTAFLVAVIFFWVGFALGAAVLFGSVVYFGRHDEPAPPVTPAIRGGDK